MSIPKSVFIVTQGSYSDYHICGVYSTRALAESAVDELNRATTYYGDQDIEEWFIDNCAGAPGSRREFSITMKQDGTVTKFEMGDYPSCAPSGERYRRHDTPADAWCFNVMAETLEHAIKIVNEKRIQMLAMNDWPIEQHYPTPSAPFTAHLYPSPKPGEGGWISNPKTMNFMGLAQVGICGISKPTSGERYPSAPSISRLGTRVLCGLKTLTQARELSSGTGIAPNTGDATSNRERHRMAGVGALSR